MGAKYEIRYVKNGCCPYAFYQWTNNFVKALWRIIRLRYIGLAGIRYPIVSLNIRAGYIKPEDCNADYCAHECERQEADDDDQL